MQILYELILVGIMNILETGTVILILHKLNRQIFPKLRYRLGMTIIISLVTMGMVYFQVPLISVIIPIILVAIIKWVSEISFKKIITLYAIVMIYTIINQLLILSILAFMGAASNSFYTAIAGNILLFVVALLTYQYIPIDRVVPLIDRFETIIFWLVALIGIPLVIYLIAWKIDYNSINYIGLMVIGIVLWTGIVALVFKELFKIKEKEKANEIYMEYNPMLENLISDVKAKQHDIKNQLHAIYGIAERKGDGELTTYLQSIIDGYQFHDDDALLNTGSNIVSSILYSKKLKAKNSDIDFKVNCQSPFPSYPIEDYEFVDILGNLLDNAIEATSQKVELNHKNIHINLQRENMHNVIEVKNTSDPMRLDRLSKIFDKGYSTKGNNRGFGLYNVKKIVNSNNGTIEVSYEENCVCFKIVFST